MSRTGIKSNSHKGENMNISLKTSMRSRIAAALAVICAVVGIAVFSGSASAAATMQASTGTTTAGAVTSLDVKTKLTGSGNALRQYGAKILLPGALWINFPAAGSPSQMCPPTAYTDVFTLMNPGTTGFDASQCPQTAKLGTVSLGSASGGLYIVDTSPMPQFGIYFEQGIFSYGRKVGVNWNSGSTLLTVTGLQNTSSDGLRMVFNNPNRAGGLPANFWRLAPAGTEDCVASPQVTGSVWNYATFSLNATETTAAPGSLTMTGCENTFSASTSTNVAGSNTALTITAGVRASQRLYGASFKIPGNVSIFTSGWGPSSGYCPFESISSTSGPVTPNWPALDLAACPNGTRIGTAKLGGASGGIYVVEHSPLPELAVYFDQGVATPYGRSITVDWGAEGYGETNLRVFGLQGAAGEGLTLKFDNPARQLWRMDQSECYAQNAEAALRTYPASGSGASVAQPTLYSNLTITGC